MLADENNYRTITASCPGFKPGLSYQQFCHILRSLLNQADSDKTGG